MAIERTIEHKIGDKYVDFDIYDSVQVGDRIQSGPYFFEIPDRDTLKQVKEGSLEGVEIQDERAKKDTPLDDGRQERIAQALTRLDPEDEAHWTKGGLPDLQVVKEYVGEYVQRDEIPVGFTRDTA